MQMVEKEFSSAGEVRSKKATKLMDMRRYQAQEERTERTHMDQRRPGLHLRTCSIQQVNTAEDNRLTKGMRGSLVKTSK